MTSLIETFSQSQAEQAYNIIIENAWSWAEKFHPFFEENGWTYAHEYSYYVPSIYDIFKNIERAAHSIKSEAAGKEEYFYSSGRIEIFVTPLYRHDVELGVDISVKLICKEFNI